jgi:hypothetical protein
MKSKIMSRICIIVLVVVVHIAWCATSYAQFSINWASIDGGAGESGGGPFSLSGTIGQPDAGVMGGSGYTVIGGFWAFAAGTSSATPLLSIEHLGANARVFWPLPGTGFSLQEAGALTGSPWTTTAFTYQTNSTHIFVIFPPAGSSKFFRLYAP